MELHPENSETAQVVTIMVRRLFAQPMSPVADVCNAALSGVVTGVALSRSPAAAIDVAQSALSALDDPDVTDSLRRLSEKATEKKGEDDG